MGSPDTPGPAYRLEVRAAQGSRAYPLGQPLTVGRAGDNDVVLDSGDVSRYHAVVARGPGGPTITDLGSSNGTFVEGVRLEARVPRALRPGDAVAIGTYALRVVAAGEEQHRQLIATRVPGPAPLPATAVAPAPPPPVPPAAPPPVIPSPPAVVPPPAPVQQPDRAPASAPWSPAPPDLAEVPHGEPETRPRWRLRRRTGLPLAVIAVLAFAAFIGARTVNDVILDPDFYLDALDEEKVFDRVFDDLVNDPSLADATSTFLGGSTAPPEERARQAKAIAPPKDLRSAVKEPTANLARFLDEDEALKLATNVTPFLSAVPSGAKSELLSAPSFRTTTAGGKEQTVFGPFDGALSRLDKRLDQIQLAAKIADTTEPIALPLFVAALAAILALGYREPLRAGRWVGGALIAAGLVGTVGWFASKGLVKDYVRDIALEDAGNLPRPFQQIIDDAVSRAVDNLTPHLAGPSIIALVAGVALLAATVIVPALRRRSALAPPGAVA